ncbi:MAG: DNA repair protein RecN [Dysgonamonadaceae bacterium]|jgi:DNA repair protein RecN (Recombination protein N)|nr:DNA repair protein RecN [Dysgonamonadaceae bacterium]
MLKSLTIQNYALISRLAIDFSGGLSVITGETGAGKSIIIGALSLILGQRADAGAIKQNEEKCFIEGLFDVSSYESLQSFFAEREWDYDAQNCILRREIWRSGKSRAFINDTPVNLNDLKELGAFLIDIHSQHQNLLLSNNRFQLQVLDVLSGNKALRDRFQDEYRSFLAIRKQLQELREKAARQASEQEYLLFQLQQLNEARLKEGEQSELETESETLRHIEEIKSGLHLIGHRLSNDDGGILPALKEALQTAQSTGRIYPFSLGVAERLQTAYLDLEDLLSDVDSRQEKLELDPERLQQVNERLDLFYSLQQKHRVHSVEDLLALKNRLEGQLQEMENDGESIEKLQRQLDNAQREMLQLSEELSETRKSTAASLEKQLIGKVCVLGMPYMQFRCQISGKEFPDATGADDVSFLFSANRNGELKPVAQTASGGEISRLMLGIKALIAGATALPTIIFDEIDTGVSGETADKMGSIMHAMGSVMQVIAITHLPQIAAQGDTQFFVYKDENSRQTETQIRRLSDDERIREIAQLLSGSELTNAAIENAKQLLKK